MLVGALAMFFALDVAFLLSLAGMPFVADALGQAIIEVLPGWITIPLIELLHFWAKSLLVVGVLALFFVDGAVTGVLAVSPRRVRTSTSPPSAQQSEVTSALFCWRASARR